MTIEDTPPKSNLMRKRVGGVPVVYLAGGVVLILAVYAYRARSTTTKAGDAATATPVDGTGTLGGEVYPNMPQGTVIVAPVTSAPSGPSNSSIETNDQWLRSGVTLLAKTGKGPGVAQEALQAYLNGNRLSYEQGAMRDTVLSELGLPPYPPDSGGTDPKTVDPTSTTVPPAPIPVPIVRPPVNVPQPAPPPFVTPSPRPAPAPAPAAAHPSTYAGSLGGPANFPGAIIKRGQRGTYVARIQRDLHIPADGIFGPQTAAAVRSYQATHGLVPDGQVGPLTWAKMYGGTR